MKNRLRARTLIFVLATVTLVMSGCLSHTDGVVQVGDLRTEDTFVEVGEATAVKVNVDMGQGDLVIRPGGDHLMEATFEYNVGRWKPTFTYVDEGDLWNLTVRQPRQDLEVEGDARNDWALDFGLVIPMEVNVHMGSGDAHVRLTGLDIVAVTVTTGAGQVTLDLTGPWYYNVVARVGNGAGDVGLIVPSDTGVQISVVQGAGTVIAPGFEQVNGNYVNDAFDTADVLMLIAVDIGSGNLQVLEEP